LCAYKHEWPLRANAGFLENAEMNEKTRELWIELDGAEENGAFYLASPCKADLTVQKTECQCKEYFDSDTVYSNIVIQGWVEDPAYGASGGEAFHDHYVDDTYPVSVEFRKDGDEFVHTFKYPLGESLTFTYMPEGSTPDEWREITLENGGKVNDPLMLEQAVRSMERENMVDWIKSNAGINVFSTGTELNVVDRYENNYGQNTIYKSCVKGSWWKLAVGILASPSGPGAIAAYCATTTAVSAAGAWLLAGTMAGDKWPNGIIDQ
jgi:hypothetical protein